MVEINALPDKWTISTLGKIVRFEYGKGLTAAKRQSGEIPVYGSNGIVGYHSEALVKVPCLVIGRKGAAGEVHKTDIPCWPIDTTYYVVPPENINLSFLYYLLKNLGLGRLDRSTAIPGLNRNDAYSEQVAIPPLSVQERIVAKIEELFTQLDAGMAALKRVQAGLKRYKASVLKAAVEGKLVPQDPSDEPAEELLRRMGKMPLEGEELPTLPPGWCWTAIGDVGKVKGGKRLPAGHTYSNKKTDNPYIRVVDFENFTIKKSDIKYLRDETQKAIRNYIINKEDVYISIAGSIGKVGIIPDYLNGANLTENAAKITNLRIVQNKYLVYFLASAFGHEQILSSTISTNQPKLALFRIEKINIPLPPINEQIRVIDEVDRRLSILSEIEITVEEAILDGSRLRQAILKQAFEGKL